MNTFEKKLDQQPHLEIQVAATETQVIFAWGEDILERAHRLAHGIEEQVQRLLDAPPDAPASASPNPNRASCHLHRADKQTGTEYPVDDPAHRW